MPMLTRPSMNGRGMDERQNEITGEGQPKRALSIDGAGGSIPGAKAETPGSLTGTTIGNYLIGERIGGGSSGDGLSRPRPGA